LNRESFVVDIFFDLIKAVIDHNIDLEKQDYRIRGKINVWLKSLGTH
jgi:hypothetical protein